MLIIGIHLIGNWLRIDHYWLFSVFWRGRMPVEISGEQGLNAVQSFIFGLLGVGLAVGVAYGAADRAIEANTTAIEANKQLIVAAQTAHTKVEDRLNTLALRLENVATRLEMQTPP